jgi:hypothetical protein
MPKERNKADGYREKAYEGDTKAMHKKFKYGLPLILLAQIALIYFICNFSHRSYV